MEMGNTIHNIEKRANIENQIVPKLFWMIVVLIFEQSCF